MSNTTKLKRPSFRRNSNWESMGVPVIRTGKDRRRWEAAKRAFPLSLADYDELLSEVQTPEGRALLLADRKQLIESGGDNNAETN